MSNNLSQQTKKTARVRNLFVTALVLVWALGTVTNAAAQIPRHEHPGAEEIVILETGTSRVHLGDIVRYVGAGATVFIPPNKWISVDNIGKEPVSLIAIFSEPGYEEYMPAISVREGENNSPMSKDELNAIRKQHPHSVTYE